MGIVLLAVWLVLWGISQLTNLGVIENPGLAILAFFVAFLLIFPVSVNINRK